MNTLSKLNTDLESVRRDQSKCAAQLAEIGAERFDLKSNPSGKNVIVAAAEQHLIEQLANAELGEPSDVANAEKELATAKALPDDGFERASRLRVLDTLEQRHTDKHGELHARGIALIEQIKQAEVEALNAVAARLRKEAEESIKTTARLESLLIGVQVELNARGASYPFAPLIERGITLNNQLSPRAASEILLAEINA